MDRHVSRPTIQLGALCAFLLLPVGAQASLARKAAGAGNMGDSGAFTADTAVELEQEEDGRVLVLEAALQVQLLGRLQFLAEAVLLERESFVGEETAAGIGDTDLILSWLMLTDEAWAPSLVLATEVKLPTASGDLGTGKPDYSALLVVEKEIGELELSIELELATFGSAPGEELKDQFIHTFGAEYSVSDLLAVYVEIFGNSAPSALESRTDAATLGVELDFSRSDAFAPYLSLEIDTEKVAVVRAGIEWVW